MDWDDVIKNIGYVYVVITSLTARIVRHDFVEARSQVETVMTMMDE